MKLKGIYTAMTAFALVAAPTMASAAPVATPLTQPAPESVKGDNALAGGSGIVIAVLAAAAVIAGIVVVARNKDKPNSP